MPRTEKPLDSLAGPLAAFAHDLRALREKAGRPPYRVLAKRAGFAASTLSVAASATVLPSLDVTLAYVQACGGDPEPWRERWHELAAHVVRDDAEEEPVTAPVERAEPTESSTDHGAARRSVSLVARAALIVLVAVATAAITRQVMSHRPQSSQVSRLQMNELYQVIRQGRSLPSDAGASADLAAGRAQPGDPGLLATAMAVRTDQAAQVQRLDVSQVPDGPQMAQALHDFWTDRAEADMLYAVSVSGQAANAPVSGMARAAFTDLESDAQQAGSDAAYLWNEHAASVGLPRISESEL